jgi:hypothetical protein
MIASALDTTVPPQGTLWAEYSNSAAGTERQVYCLGLVVVGVCLTHRGAEPVF